MSKSYSKIRHIQESNVRLEKRVINEQSSGPRNISLSLDCGKKTLGKLPMTTQQISTWCKTGTPQPNTPTPSHGGVPNRGGAM
jgi:hypothetical protein